MKSTKMKCIKAFNSNALKLETGKHYDVSHKDNGNLIVFTKDGWFKVSDYEEYLETIQENENGNKLLLVL